MITGFVGESMTAGRLLFPSVGVVQDRNTYDTMVNGGINPILHLGSNTITFNGGLQFTVRRDTISPRFMNQDLFRQFLYVYTSSFFNWISVTGTAQRGSRAHLRIRVFTPATCSPTSSSRWAGHGAALLSSRDTPRATCCSGHSWRNISVRRPMADCSTNSAIV